MDSTVIDPDYVMQPDFVLPEPAQWEVEAFLELMEAFDDPEPQE